MRQTAEIEIKPWRAIAAQPNAREAVAQIFYEAAGTQTFASPEAKSAFQTLWLDGYLDSDPDLAWVACNRAGAFVGYVIASQRNPARDPQFAELDYFQAIGEITARTPAHLHINLAAPWRGRGIGQRLIAAVCCQLSALGARGVHVMTAAGARNVGFYRRCQFEPVACVQWRGRALMVLVRELPPVPPSA